MWQSVPQIRFIKLPPRRDLLSNWWMFQMFSPSFKEEDRIKTKSKSCFLFYCTHSCFLCPFCVCFLDSPVHNSWHAVMFMFTLCYHCNATTNSPKPTQNYVLKLQFVTQVYFQLLISDMINDSVLGRNRVAIRCHSVAGYTLPLCLLCLSKIYCLEDKSFLYIERDT